MGQDIHGCLEWLDTHYSNGVGRWRHLDGWIETDNPRGGEVKDTDGYLLHDCNWPGLCPSYRDYAVFWILKELGKKSNGWGSDDAPPDGASMNHLVDRADHTWLTINLEDIEKLEANETQIKNLLQWDADSHYPIERYKESWDAFRKKLLMAVERTWPFALRDKYHETPGKVKPKIRLLIGFDS